LLFEDDKFGEEDNDNDDAAGGGLCESIALGEDRNSKQRISST